MKFILCFSALFALVAVNSAANIVCYFDSWSVYRTGNGKLVPQNVDPDICTHVLFSFVGLNSDGSVKILDQWEAINLNGISDLINLKQLNKDLKVLVSMGGWNEGSTVYSSVIGNPILRSILVQNIVNFVKQYGFDGFDLSWEYPNGRGGVPADKQNLVYFLKELKSALGDLTLSIAGSGLISQIDLSYDVPSISQSVDMINLMSYDYHGSYDGVVGHASPLYPAAADIQRQSTALNVNATVNFWIERGANSSKINVGIVTYGRGFTLADPTKTSLYDATIGPSTAGPYTQESGMMGYNEVCEFLKNWLYVFDNDEKVPHIISGNQWIGFEDVSSVATKAKYAKDLSLGGVAVWSIGTDDFNGVCGGGKFPLINSIKAALTD